MDKGEKQKTTFFERVQGQFLRIYKSIIVQHHLNRIRRMEIRDVLTDPMARMLFSEYLILKNATKETDILLNWKCYELCRKIRENPDLINEGNVFENLIHSSPSTIWEQDLWILIHKYNKHKNKEELRIILWKLEDECIQNMQNHSNYYKFMTDLNFKSWRIENLISEVYNNRKFRHYAPHFLDLENNPYFIV